MSPADLRVRRLELGLTQTELAHALGVHARTVAHWEQGRRAIGPLVELALASVPARSPECDVWSRRRWQLWEDRLVTASAAKAPALALRLGRTPGAIRQRRLVLGFRRL